jgi:hypothetical protein
LCGATCLASATNEIAVSTRSSVQVVALLRGARRLDLVVVVHELGRPLAGVATQEPVEALEAAPERPPVVRSGGRLELRRHQVVLADEVGVVAVLLEHLGQEAVLERDLPVVARVARGELVDRGGRVCVVVARMSATASTAPSCASACTAARLRPAHRCSASRSGCRSSRAGRSRCRRARSSGRSARPAARGAPPATPESTPPWSSRRPPRSSPRPGTRSAAASRPCRSAACPMLLVAPMHPHGAAPPDPTRPRGASSEAGETPASSGSSDDGHPPVVHHRSRMGTTTREGRDGTERR